MEYIHINVCTWGVCVLNHCIVLVCIAYGEKCLENLIEKNTIDSNLHVQLILKFIEYFSSEHALTYLLALKCYSLL